MHHKKNGDQPGNILDLSMIVLPCRTREKADALAAALGDGAEAVDYADVASGKVTGHVLLNSTSIGMHPAEEETPVSAEALTSYKLVFDAVYTPLQTRLLRVRNSCPLLSPYFPS